MNNKIDDLLNAIKLGGMLREKEEPACKKSNPVVIILAVIGAIASVAAIAYAVYRYFTPDYLEDFEDDFDDDFDDNFEEDDDEEEETGAKEAHSCCCDSKTDEVTE